MPRHIEVYIDGVPLSSVGPFLIQEVYEDAPTLELTEGDRPGRYGHRLLSRKRQTLKVAVELVIRELYDLSVRARAIETLAKWANGSMLEFSNRPNRCLMVSCAAEPALSAVRDYTSRIRIEWTAYTVPYWQDKRLSSSALESGAAGSANVYIPGTVESPLRLTVAPASGTLTSFSATLGGSTVALTGLSVPAGSVLVFDRDPLDNLMIAMNGVSQLSHRSAASADDLMAPPGYAAFSYTADTACAVTLSARGRYA